MHKLQAENTLRQTDVGPCISSAPDTAEKEAKTKYDESYLPPVSIFVPFRFSNISVTLCFTIQALDRLHVTQRSIPLNSLFFFPFIYLFALYFLFYFIGVYLIYNVCYFQGYSKVNQLYIDMYLFFFRFCSHIGYHRVLSRVPCATQ